MPRRRSAEAIAVVALWMALGFIGRGRIDGNLYLLLGVPLTIAFQRYVARRPIAALWVRDATQLTLTRRAVILSVLLAITPAAILVRALLYVSRHGWDWSVLSLISAICGAVAAGFAIDRATRATITELFSCLAAAGGLGVVLVAAFWRTSGLRLPSASDFASTATTSFLIYVPLCFILEEVVFRGALDAHVYRPGEKWYWTTALLTSLLWGLWHFPIARPFGHQISTLVTISVVHVAIGLPLAHYWRRSGNLLVPAVSHAFIDAIRNGLA